MALPKQPATETMSITEARENFGEVVTRPRRGEGRVIVEDAGTPVGGIVSIEDIRRLEEMDRELAGIEDILQRTGSGFRGIPADEIEREIGNAIAEVEADYRVNREEKTESGS